MAHIDKEVYAASCNPPRRAKRPRIDASELNTISSPRTRAGDVTSSPSSVTPQPRPILPKRAMPSGKTASSSVGSTSPVIQPTNESSTSLVPVSTNPPVKRGRKPGPLSRSAREAQRRLNHSIIEKARRTKINNALATLKELVPLDYAKKAKAQGNGSDNEDDVDEDDGDAEYDGEGKKSKPKQAGKKEEKEREYKLEILVRTVAFMQDLLQRVAVLEQTNAVCSSCGMALDTPSKHSQTDTSPHTSSRQASPSSEVLSPGTAHRAKRPRIAGGQEPSEPDHAVSPLSTPSQEPIQDNAVTRHRLPPISSWLPETLLDTSNFNVSSPSRIERNAKDTIPPLQLPTPPSSTHFDPTTTAAGSASATPFTIPVGGAHQKVLSPTLTRTPEDEHAATMLLQISGGRLSSSPTFRPLPPSIIPFTGPMSSIPPSLPSPALARADPGADHDQGRRDGIAIQTPASLLGLVTPPTG